jgi:mRNA interferase YafO
MDIKVFVHKRLRETFEPTLLAAIRDRFLDYKQTGKVPDTFGRDVQYTRPESVKESDLWHIHIKDATSRNWEKPWIQVFNMTSDTALIYTMGAKNPGHYLIISIIENAHTYYGGTEKYLRAMAEIARNFQKYY